LRFLSHIWIHSGEVSNMSIMRSFVSLMDFSILVKSAFMPLITLRMAKNATTIKRHAKTVRKTSIDKLIVKY